MLGCSKIENSISLFLRRGLDFGHTLELCHETSFVEDFVSTSY